MKIQLLISHTLRIGVSIACVIAAVGGVIYLVSHGGDPMPDYTHFSYTEAHPAEYTTLGGIFAGLGRMDARRWIQLGVIALILTPILRVFLSLFVFLNCLYWFYAAITSIVLAIIIVNSVL